MFLLLVGCVVQKTNTSSYAPSKYRIVDQMNFPEVPLVRANVCKDMKLDGKLGEASWKKARVYSDLTSDGGEGLSDFPTTCRILLEGRTLWIGMKCDIPLDKNGMVVKNAYSKEYFEIFIDNGWTCRTFHQIEIDMRWGLSIPGVPKELKAVEYAYDKYEMGYTAEIKIDLDKLDQIEKPNLERIGLNITRSAFYQWRREQSLVGIVGQSQKAHQFWTVDLTGNATERLPTSAYKPLFQSKVNLPVLAKIIISEWDKIKDQFKKDNNWGLMDIRYRRLQWFLKRAKKDPWGRKSQLATVLYQTYLAFIKVDKTLSSSDRIIGFTKSLVKYSVENPGPMMPSNWEEKAFFSSIDGTAQPYTFYKPRNHDASKAYPLMVYLHGSGNPHYGAGTLFERNFEHENRYIKIKVNCRKAGKYGPIATRDIMEAIANVKKHYRIDNNRIYLYGYSRGGEATLKLGPLYSHMWAGLACLAGWSKGDNLENLINLPILVVHGENDSVIKYNRNTSINVIKMQEAGVPITVNLIPATGHGVPHAGDEDWLLQHKRVRVPKKIICKTEKNDPRLLKNYWVTLLGLDEIHNQAAIVAKVNKKSLDVRTANTIEFAINLIDLRNAGYKVENIKINNKYELPLPLTDFCRLSYNGKLWLLEGLQKEPKIDLTKYQAGGVENIYWNGPVLVVAPVELMEFAKYVATRDMKQSNSRFIKIPVKLDTEVTEKEIASHNIILVGGPQRNKLSKKLTSLEWPLKENENKIKVSNKEYDLNEYGYWIITRNPKAHNRRVWMMSAKNIKAFDRKSAMVNTGIYFKVRPDILIFHIKDNEVKALQQLNVNWKLMRGKMYPW